MLLVHSRGYYKNSVLDSDEIGDVHEGLVHPRVGGDVVDGKEGSEVVHHVLGVVTKRDDRQHHLQPYCNMSRFVSTMATRKYWKETVLYIHQNIS